MDAVQLSSLALRVAEEIETAGGAGRAVAQEHLRAIGAVAVERGWAANVGEFTAYVTGMFRDRRGGRPDGPVARGEHDARTGRSLTAWMHANAAQSG